MSGVKEALVRCPWHIVIGAGLPCLPVADSRIGWAYMFAGIAWFIAYQCLQYQYNTRKKLVQEAREDGDKEVRKLVKDDSFKDIFETGVSFGIAVALILVLRNVGVL